VESEASTLLEPIFLLVAMDVYSDISACSSAAWPVGKFGMLIAASGNLNSYRHETIRAYRHSPFMFAFNFLF
jgi:hypothetical protein